MVLDFTGKMRLLTKTDKTSKSIADCIEYIYVHIQDRITPDDLAAHTGLSPSHLSRLFKKGTGVSVSDYIREKRVEQAQELLQFCDFRTCIHNRWTASWRGFCRCSALNFLAIHKVCLRKLALNSSKIPCQSAIPRL